MNSSADAHTIASQDEQFLHQLHGIVEEHIDSGEVSVELISREMGISSSTFYRRIKELTGTSPVEYIRDVQLTKAAVLLSSNYGNVSEVAYEAGFNNLSYFSKCFKEKYGINPARYSKLRIHKKSLSHYLTSFVGREEEIREIVSLIVRNRLVNVTGPAGTGKTRLASEVLLQIRDAFRDGIFDVHLASISDSQLVPSGILQALQVPEHPLKTAMDTLREALQTKQVLLLLDNFEHVTDAAFQINELLRHCPDLKVLVTSRVSLHLSGEVQYPLHPLATPEPVEQVDIEDLERIKGYPAIELFVDRAKQFNKEFDLTEGNAPTIIGICRKLDGLPLALELAASQTRMIAPKDLLKQLDVGLSILKSDDIDRSERHDSLQKAIAWSYDLLKEREQAYFQRLALTPDSFDLKVAESLWPESEDSDFIDGIRDLSDNNLIQTFETGGEIRFKLLETLKVFGRGKLRESGKELRLIRKLATHYLELAHKAEQQLNGPEQKMWIARLNRELDNFRGVLGYLEQHREVKLGLQLSTSLWRYWNMQNMNEEGIEWLRSFITLTDRLKSHELTPAIYELKGKAHSAIGIALVIRSLDLEGATAHLRQALTVFRKLDNKNELSITLNHYGCALVHFNDFDNALAINNQAKKLNEKLDNKRGISVSLCNLAMAAYWQGELVEAKEMYKKGIALREEIGDLRGVAYLSTRLSRVELRLGKFDSAFDLLERAYDILQDLNDIQITSLIYTFKGLIYYNLGNYDKASEFLTNAYEGWAEIGRKWGMSLSSELLGLVMLSIDNPESSRKYIDNAEQLRKSVTGYRHYISFTDYCKGEWEAYQENIDRAKRYHKKALTTRIELGLQAVICESLEALAVLLFNVENYKTSTLFLSAADVLRTRIKAPSPPRFKESHKTIIAATKKELGKEVFRRLWNEGKKKAPEQLVDLV